LGGLGAVWERLVERLQSSPEISFWVFVAVRKLAPFQLSRKVSEALHDFRGALGNLQAIRGSSHQPRQKAFTGMQVAGVELFVRKAA